MPVYRTKKVKDALDKVESCLKESELTIPEVMYILNQLKRKVRSMPF
jgi:hypothetical protein